MLNLIELTSNQLTKESLNEWSAKMIALIDGGDLNALEAHAKAKAIMSALKTVIEATESQAQDEAAKYSMKTFQAYGAQVTIKQGAITPDYEQDAIWVKLKTQLKERGELVKTAFQSKGAEMTDESTGEIIQRVQAKYAKSSISVQFK